MSFSAAILSRSIRSASSRARRSFSLTVFGAGCIIKSTGGSDPSGRAAKGDDL